MGSVIQFKQLDVLTYDSFVKNILNFFKYINVLHKTNICYNQQDTRVYPFDYFKKYYYPTVLGKETTQNGSVQCILYPTTAV